MKQHGYSLLELLIVTVVLGIVAAMAIPYFLGVLDRSRQRTTMSDLRTVSLGLEQYRIDEGGYPLVTDILVLRGIIEDGYLPRMPIEDGWGIDLTIETSADDYTICSNGRDHAGNCALETAGATTDPDLGIVMWSGTFVQWPEGTQKP